MRRIHHAFVRGKTLALMLTIVVAALLTGCAGVHPLTPEEQFAAQVDGFVAELLAQQPAGLDVMAPVAVMPGSLISGGEYSRLEEYAVERLANTLRMSRKLYTPSRQNWFELRERQPLTFAGQPDNKRSYLDSLVVYLVAVVNDPVLKRVTLQATAVDSTGKPIPGVLAETVFPTGEAASPAMLQYQAKPQRNPIPEGLEERPFVSMDRLAYSLASELAAAYQAHIGAAEDAPAESEVKIVLQTRTVNGAAGGAFLQQMESALQQAFVTRKGFTCAVSQKDFASTFDQIDFYRKNRQLFEMDETLLSPGSVMLLAETFPHRESGKIGINLRSLWRITPLADKQGGVLADNLGGTYLSGFAARAYLLTEGQVIGGKSGSAIIRSPKDRSSYQPDGSRGFE